MPVRIYYEDTDFTGLVYHANYVRYCERGRSDFLRLAGVHHSLLLAEAEPLGFAVNKLNLEFVKPARIDDALIVRSMFETIKGPRIFITQEIERAGEILVRAEVQVCCISLTGKPKRPPGVLLDRLKPFLEPSASSF
ncbi:MAG: YbgC/FadM family acyl-CoA thioesterase [Hyphomonadaceae bacterium JAD_PAG50586_4]|nr:MAG: YbgC/FadM family acyl-CoA thioesterase [Hyphomonadaceae bacterium JAD_PAG50586_4]